MKLLHTKKFRYGSVSLALTIVIVAAVILLNAIVTALVKHNGWYLDMTPEKRFTLSSEAKTLLDGMDQTKKVTVIFCDDEDNIEQNGYQLDALETVRDIAGRYDNVNVKYVDILTNPSAVQEYKNKSGQNINKQSVIVTSGTECRVFTMGALFTYDSSNNIVGYNGEQRLVSAILSVTQDEKPVVCVTTNHGELAGLQNGTSLLELLIEIGYDVRQIDLAKDDIPAECRLVLVFDPKEDFLAVNSYQNVSELTKLDRFLSNENSLMVFFDYETPYLENFEAFLAEWGIAIARYEKSDVAPDAWANFLIEDRDHSLVGGNGYQNVATYVTSSVGGSLTSHLWSGVANPKSVIFPMAGAIATPRSGIMAGDSADDGSWYYFKNGITRNGYDVFLSSGDAVAMAGGEKVNAEAPFSYMRVTRQEPSDVSDANAQAKRANVLACASTEFASETALGTAYGNHAMLTYALSALGQRVITVSIDCKYYADTTIDTITATAANQYTVVLTVVPASIIFIAGIYIMVRRKYR